MNLRPLHDRVVIKRLDSEEITASGIIIPDSAQEKATQGTVIAVGPGARGSDGDILPMAVRKGDRVLIGKWSGNEVTLDGEEVVILHEFDLIGVIGSAKKSK